MSRLKIKKKSLSMEERQRTVKALAAFAHAAGDTCILCGGPPEALGIFTPKEQEAYNAPDGRRLFFPYYVCVECAEKRWSEVIRTIEEEAAKQAAGFTLRTLDIDPDGDIHGRTYSRAPQPGMN